jgi:hypothetical protein
MGLKDIISNFVSGKKETKEKFKKLQEDIRLHKMAEEREKSANQREVERYFREEKEKEFAEILDQIRKKKNKEMWSTNMLKQKGTILNEDKNILHDDNPILKQKNIFGCPSIPFIGGGSSFFK